MPNEQVHQDYANWTPSFGDRVYAYNVCSDELDEFALVTMVNGHLCSCVECEQVVDVYKLTCDTPSFHNSPSGMCEKCLRKLDTVWTWKEIMEEYWRCVSEQGLAEDMMNMANVYPDNLMTGKKKWNSWTIEQRKSYLIDCDITISDDRLKDYDEADKIVREYMSEDFDEYYEEGDPVCFDQFSTEMQLKLEQERGGIRGVIEKLHDEGYHDYCNPTYKEEECQ